MRTRTALSILTLPTLWLLLSSCGQTPTSARTAQATRAVTAGTSSVQLHAQAVTDSTGQLVVWGNSAPDLVDNPTFTAVAMGSSWGLALRSDGQIAAVGSSASGPIDPPALPTGVTYTGVAAGDGHALALRSDGQVVAWGRNDFGQTTVPALPTGMTYTRVGAGVNYSLALRSDGRIVGWGDNGLGQLNTTLAPAGVTYTALVGGSSHTLALRSDGQIVGWGYATRGQLDVPVLPNGVTYTAVAAGSLHTLALRSDGRVMAFGWGGQGQLSVPPLPAGMSYTAISARNQTSAALRSDGTIVVWGETASASVPAPAAPGSRYTALAIGNYSGLAIRQTDNTPPTAPGVPTGSPLNNSGAFTLSWAASTDQESNPLTYTLEGKSSASDATWTTVASGLTSPTYALSSVAEGTWTYRVRASDGTVDGPNSEVATIKVDKAAPTAPSTVLINGAAPIDGWYKDSAAITFSGSTDPALADGTPGSGVKSYQGMTLTSTGTLDYSGTATDAAGNVSAPTTGSVNVDARPPDVTVFCPPTVPYLSANRFLTWDAADGGSGLVGPSRGNILLPSDTVGDKTASVSVSDAVGHTTTKTCTFTVVNMPPTPRGDPSYTGLPATNSAQVTLKWPASYDPEGSALTYTLRRQSTADSTAWTTVASGLTANSATFNESEGTWMYQVSANDGLVDGPFSGVSSPLKVDRTAPSAPVAGFDSTPVGGWFKDSVAVSFSGSTDPKLADGTDGSGTMRLTYAGAQTFTSTGTYTGTATDLAGNVSTTTGTVKVDATAPTVAFTNCPVTVPYQGTQSAAWTASDGESGLSGPSTGSVGLPTGTLGQQTVTKTVADAVGHSTTASCTFTVANSAPTAPGAPTTSANPNKTGAFAISWAPSTDADGDAVTYTLEGKSSAATAQWTTVASGLTSAAYALSNVTEGTWTYRVRANDGKVDGPSSTASADIKVDQSAPGAPTVTLTGTKIGEWYKGAVTVDFGNSTDHVLADGSAGSGGVTYQGSTTLTASGTYTGTATDAVGNVSSATSGSVKVDATAPTVAFTNCPVTVPLKATQSVAWTASDTGSGLQGASSGSVNLSTATLGQQTVTMTAVDGVGHSTTASCTFTVVNTPPTAPGVPTSGTSLTKTGAFSLSWAASTDADGDTLTYTLEGKSSATNAQWTPVASDVMGTTYAVTTVTEGSWTYRVRANDGKVDGPSSGSSAAIKVDQSAPSAPTATFSSTPVGGWFKDSVTVGFGSSTDPALQDGSAGSGGVTYQGGKTLTTSGTYSGTATDAVGNVSAATSGTVKVDAALPTIAFTNCPATVVLGSSQSVTWSAQDGESGLSGANTGSVTIPTGTVGPQSVTATVTDVVGHLATATCKTTVIYPFTGFLQPVDNLPTLNTAKAGSAVPVKFSLGGSYGLNVMTAAAGLVACNTTGPSDDIEQTVTASTSGLSYDPLTKVYTYVWKTDKTWANSCRMLTVTLNDGTPHQALFSFR